MTLNDPTWPFWTWFDLNWPLGSKYFKVKCFRGHSRSLGIISGHIGSLLLIFGKCRSLKSSYLLMVTVGGLLLGRNRCEKKPSFILEWSRHGASSSPSRNLSFSEKNAIFDENLWFFEKNFYLKMFPEKFYIIYTQPILVISSHFKNSISLAIHSNNIPVPTERIFFRGPAINDLRSFIASVASVVT